MKRLKNKFLRAFFSCCLLFALLTAAQAAEPTRYEVNTAAELAERLNVKIRHTNHIIERLTTAGYAVQTGMKSTGTKGRPTRIYRIDI